MLVSRAFYFCAYYSPSYPPLWVPLLPFRHLPLTSLPPSLLLLTAPCLAPSPTASSPWPTGRRATTARPSASCSKHTNLPLTHHPSLPPSLPHSALYRALAYRFLAVAHWEKSDHGTAIGLLLQAQTLLKPRADGVSSGLPSTDDSRFLSKYKPQVEILRKEVNGMLTSWKQDNSMIYFAAIVDAMSLPPLPAGANMVQLTKYDYVSSLPPILFSEPAEAKTS